LALTRTGDIELRPDADTLGRMDVRTESGDIDVSLPAPPKFDLRLVTDRGDAENDYGVPLRVEDDHHSASIGGGEGGGPQLRLTTSHGHIVVRKAGVEATK
jgi:hypothetical protein